MMTLKLHCRYKWPRKKLSEKKKLQAHNALQGKQHIARQLPTCSSMSKYMKQMWRDSNKISLWLKKRVNDILEEFKENWIKKRVKVAVCRESSWQPEKSRNGEKLETMKDHAQETIQQSSASRALTPYPSR